MINWLESDKFIQALMDRGVDKGIIISAIREVRGEKAELPIVPVETLAQEPPEFKPYDPNDTEDPIPF